MKENSSVSKFVGRGDPDQGARWSGDSVAGTAALDPGLGTE